MHNTNADHFNQIPYGVLIAISILICVYLNDRFQNRRCLFIVLFLLPNIAGAFGLRYVPLDRKVGRLICYYLTGPYNAAFVLILSMQIANTAGEYRECPSPDKIYAIWDTDEDKLQNRPHEKGRHQRCPLPRLLYREYCGPVLLQV